MFRYTFFFLLSVTHTTLTIVPYKPTFAHLRVSRFFTSLSASVLRYETPFRVNIHSHELTLHDTALWSIVHTSPASCEKGVTFSRKEEKRERRRGRKREKKWKERGHNEYRTPGGQLLILSSPSATFAILHDLVRSFPPTGAQLPYHVTTKPTNRSCSYSATMMDNHGTHATREWRRENHYGRCSNFQLYFSSTTVIRFTIFLFNFLISTHIVHMCLPSD